MKIYNCTEISKILGQLLTQHPIIPKHSPTEILKKSKVLVDLPPPTPQKWNYPSF